MAAKEKRLINVGVDLGTSYTKVSFRDLVEDESYLIPLRPTRDGYERYILPSTVGLARGRLQFGLETLSEEQEGLRVFRSFKTCLACLAGIVDCRGCEPQYLGREDKRGRFKQAGFGELSSLEIAAYYLAYVMGYAKQYVTELYPVQRLDLSFNFNTAIPIAHLESGATRDLFERAAWIGARMAGYLPQDVTWEGARSFFNFLKSRPVPDESVRNSFVLPEPVAAVIAFLNSPAADDGLYAIADCGAGTTDVSFFRRFTAGLGKEPRLSFYNCENLRIGGDDIDRAIAALIQQELPEAIWSDSTYVLCARKAKEAGWEDGLIPVNLPETQILLDGGTVGKALEGVTGRLFEGYRRCWASAFEKEKSEGRWKEFRIFLLGGSLRLGGVRRALIRRPWDRVQKVLPEGLSLPADFSCADDSAPGVLEAHADLFSVVYGVSHHRAQYPQFYNPKDVRGHGYAHEQAAATVLGRALESGLKRLTR